MACRRVGQLATKNTAVFLCDIQEKFRPAVQYFEPMVAITNRVLTAAKMLDVPVIVTEQYPKGLGHTAKEVGLDKYPDIKIFEKSQFSMMTDDVVAKMKQDHPDVKNIVICGLETHVCVQCTALAALELGFDVHIVSDAVSSRAMVDRMVALDRMKAAGAWLTTSEAVILGLVADSAHPKFRDIQKLILKSAPDTGLCPMR